MMRNSDASTTNARLALLAFPAFVAATLAIGLDWPAEFAIEVLLPAALLPTMLAVGRLRRQALLSRNRHEAFAQRLIDVIPQPFYVKDRDGHYLMINKALQEHLGLPVSHIIGRTSYEFATPAMAVAGRREDAAVLAGASIHNQVEDLHPQTGAPRQRLIMKGGCIDTDGRHVIVGANFDITPWRSAERALQEALTREVTLRQNTEAFVQRLIDLIPDPVYVKDGESRYLMVNQAFADYRQLDKSLITSPHYPPGPITAKRHQSQQEDLAVLDGREVVKEEEARRKTTGEEVHRIVRKRRSVYIDGRPVIVGIDHNITRWRIAERRLQRAAQEDPLTGLANRRHFRELARTEIERVTRYPEPLSLVMIDLDHFKQINDTHGHHAGDQVLCLAVERLQTTLRRPDVPARWGGEEFAILLPRTALEEAGHVADRLREELSASPLACEAGALPVTLSAGVAEYRQGESLDEFIGRADAALYVAKNAGRNRIAIA